MIYLSGIQPSGTLHLGNYIGAVMQWREQVKLLSKTDEAMFMIVDLHSLTTKRDVKEFPTHIFNLIATYIACGLVQKNTTLFVQSDVQEHTELAWFFSTITPLGVLKRMTQFKDKSGKMSEDSDVVNGGLLFYPCLMAADILLYDADFIPVGEDQIQHIEFTRDTANRFHERYKSEIFKLPKAKIQEEGARIMSLSDGTKKMSKSTGTENDLIFITDSDDEIAKKIKRAKTDSESTIFYNKEKRPEVSNLLTIMSTLSRKTIAQIESEYSSAGTKVFKDNLTQVIINEIAPIREEIFKLQNDKDFIYKTISQGGQSAQEKASAKMQQVKEVIGLLKYGS
ncbi:MAG: hypothetical protein RL208_635 [Pseudomonadota bacterium]|jgi:tryptophanyl-tRNA synthetase